MPRKCLAAQWGPFAAGRMGRDQADAAADIAKEADQKQLADWLAREHKADPIHK